MRDTQIVELAKRQFNRISRQQLLELGLRAPAIDHRVAGGRMVVVEQGVYAIAPVLDHDDLGRWMGATLTAPGTELSHVSAGAAYGFWSLPRRFETVTRPGYGGPRRHGGLLVYRSRALEGHCTQLHGVIPITTVPRTLLDLARGVSGRALARALREAIRLELTTLNELAEAIGAARRRVGTRRLAAAVARYSGLPLERARSGSEVRALEVLRAHGRPMPRLNVRIAGEEADLSWPTHRLIIEIDGGPFHLDVGEDARKEARWRAAGWIVHRIPAEDVYRRNELLLALAPGQGVPRAPA